LKLMPTHLYFWNMLVEKKSSSREREVERKLFVQLTVTGNQ
jgi:hypothetical protein